MTPVDPDWIGLPLHRTEVDGVPVVWRAAPPPLRASLSFRVGTGDEAFVTSGITHAVEHLSMRAVGRWPQEINASVGHLFTEFTTSGRPQLVAEFLAAVCEALADLPTGDLATELGVLEAEGGGGGPAASLLALRLGAFGPGLTGFAEPALRSLTPSAVHAWASRRFGRGNAVLALSGPPPEGLRLPLPVGPRQPPPALLPRPLPGRVWDDGYAGVALGLWAEVADLRRTEAFWSAMRIAGDRVEKILRHERGLAYSIEGTIAMVGPFLCQGLVTVDSHDRHADEVVDVVLGTLEAISTQGPAKVELEDDLAQSHEALTDPRGVWESTVVAAGDLLLGVDALPEADRSGLIQSLSTAELRDAVAAAADSAILLVPDDVEVDRPGWTRAPASTSPPVAGDVLRRRVGSWAPRGARLVCALADGVTLNGMPDGALTVRWADVVGVGVREDGVLEVLTGEGALLPLRARDWRGGDAVVEAMRRHVPRHLFFEVRADE